MKNLTYYQRLRALGIESLELRRLRADLLFTYKLVFGLLDMNVSEFFITQFSNKRRGHRYKLYVSTCKSSVRYNCFSHRVIRVSIRKTSTSNNNVILFSVKLTK